jgi:hypothetical protein
MQMKRKKEKNNIYTAKPAGLKKRDSLKRRRNFIHTIATNVSFFDRAVAFLYNSKRITGA